MTTLFAWLNYPTPMRLWVCFLILFPFYFFPSGTPQIADWLMAFLVLTQMPSGLRPTDGWFRHVTGPLIFFVVYAVVVSLAWLPLIGQPGDPDYRLLKFPLFYVYNLFVFLLALKLYSNYGHHFLEATFAGVILAVSVQIVLFPVSLEGGLRNQLFFNNPNQLGYFSLLAMTIFLFLDHRIRPPIWLKAGFFVATSFLAAISASKAAIVASLMLILANLLDAGFIQGRQFIGGIIAIVLLVGLAMYTETGVDLTDRTMDRIANIGTDSDDTIAGRGYDRMWLYPEYMLCGAAEGGWERFYHDPKKMFEMHSSFGTLLFCYGIPGFLAVAIFVYRVFRTSRWLETLYAIPIFAYGLTHNGLRSTLLWIFFAVVVCAGDMRRIEAEEHMNDSSPYL